MGALLQCPRKHFWSYEVGLKSTSEGAALKIGSAWHRAMEARWNGADFEKALEAAIITDGDELMAATICGLLAGYFKHYGNETFIKHVSPEVEFKQRLDGSRTFSAAGKIDGLVELHDGRLALKEDKTTSDSLAHDSDYWLRLRFNTQLMQYVLAARQLGWDVATIIYDVVRKPAISPKLIGKPAHRETPEEFSERLFKDTQERPDFYFARREVPILEDDLVEFQAQRLTLSRIILHCRAAEKRLPHRHQAWPRNVSKDTCGFCSYSTFCLQNISVNLESPPAGFKVGNPNPELTT